MKVGVLGGGQLGRMLALAGVPLGLEFVFYDPDPQACAARLGTLITGEFDNTTQLKAFAQQVDVATLEFENIPLAALEYVAQFVPVYPSPRAVSAAQDRLAEKQLLRSLGIPTPKFYALENADALVDVSTRHNEALMIKSRRLGYDGKGQLLLDSAASAFDAWNTLGGVDLIAEQIMHFKREVSIIAARSREGDIVFYPLTENLHKQGILQRSQVSMNDPLQATAEVYANRVLQALDYVGVMAVEFFDCFGDLVANEIAPRVHNSAHWTIEGSVTSQFENHLRAILDWPLGDSRARAQCVMYNVIGEMPDPARLLKANGVHLHDYGKQPRPGRKIGHINMWERNEENALLIEKLLGI